CGPTDQRSFDAPIIGLATNSTALCDAGSFETEILDAEPPTVVIATTLDDPTATQPIPLTFTFSEVVSGFSADDIVVTGGTLGAVSTADSTTFAADLTPDSSGEITVDIGAGVATDLAGNPNEAAETFSITFDNDGPAGYTVAFDQPAVNAANETAVSFTVSDAEAGASFVYTITSDGGAGEVTGTGTIGGAAPRLPGDTDDFTRGNKGGGFALAPLAMTTSEQVTGIDVSGLQDGTLTLSVTLTDPLGNEGDQATDTIEKDTVAPTVTIATTTPEPTVESPFLITLTFSEAVTGFTEDDIDVTNGTLSDFDDSAAPVYTASVTPDDFGEVTVAVNEGVATDDAGNGNAATEPLVRTFVQRFNLALSTEYVFTGPGTGTLTALVTNTGSELATRVRVKITKTFDVATGPKQLVVGAIAPGETGMAVFDFGSAGESAEVRLKAEDLVVRDDEENFDDNRTIVFLVPDDGGADVTPPEITGALSGQVFAGTVEENRINDTGVASVVLDPGATNLTLVVDPFAAGATVVSYTATPIDPMQDATGTIRATDVEGNTDTRPVSIPRTPPPPPTETLVVRLTPDDAPIFIGNGGGSFTFTGEVTNPTDGRLTQDVWLVLISPSGAEEVQFGPFSVRLGAGGMTAERFTVTVDREAEAGVYAYEGRVGDFPGEVTDTDRFTFEKLGDGSREAEPLALGRMAHAIASDAPTSTAAVVLPVLTTSAGLVWGITDDAEWAALGEAEASRNTRDADSEPEAMDRAAADADAVTDDTSADDSVAKDTEDAVADETTADLKPSAADASREGARETEQTDESAATTTEAPPVEAAPVETTSVALPDDLALNSVYPNPFTHRATVEVALPEPTDLSVTVYDLTSRLVATLAQGTLEAGYHTLELHGAALSSGVYLVRLATADGTTQTRRITLVR
ncbi:MAG: Ig-like domain-containing protein, partial [Bacteroidota bacterium]